MKFARAGEPGALRLINSVQRCEELRARDLPILPTIAGGKEQIDPFLRTRLPAVARAARAHDAATPPDPVCTTLRQWKNEFK